MAVENWPHGATPTTTSGRIHRWPTRPQQRRAGRLSYLMAPRSARLPNLKPTTVNPKDSRYERGTTGGRSDVVGTFCLRARFSENPLRQEGCVHFAGGGV